MVTLDPALRRRGPAPSGGLRAHIASALRPSRLNLRITQKPADPASLLDNLVGAGKQGWRDFDAERPRSDQIDDQLTFVGRLRSAKGLVAPGRACRSGTWMRDAVLPNT